MSLHMLAWSEKVSERLYDAQSGRYVERTGIPLEEAQKIGVNATPLDANIVICEKRTRNGSKPVYLHEVGHIAIVRVIGQQIQTRRNGHHLDSPQIVTLDDLRELVALCRHTTQ